MSNLSIVIGASGTGKSTSIRNLNHEETFIINVLDKPLPFKGYKSKYTKLTKENLSGNYAATDEYERILKQIEYINTNMPNIKNLIIDDFQYIMCNEFMRRVTERGYDKFSEIGQHAWLILMTLTKLRDDLNCFVLSHSDLNAEGVHKFKTIGNLLDDKVVPEGHCTILLHTVMNDGKYLFLTQHDGKHAAKTPMGMFESRYVDNDLAYVVNKIKEYEYGEMEEAA